jgi:biopolymer transport protein ExbB
MIGTIGDLFRDGGPVMVAIAAVSVVAWTLIAVKWLEFRDRPTWRAILRAGHCGDWRIAETGAPHVEPIAVALEIANDPRATFDGVTEPLAAAARVRVRHGLVTLAALAALLPLLGLLGTVIGMLSTFESIRLHGTADPRLLADGIRQALLTTQAGLLAAVPVLISLRFLRSKADRIADAVELCVHRLESAVANGVSPEGAA